MKVIKVILIICILLIAVLPLINNSSATKVITNDVTTNVTWKAEDNPHYIKNTISVNKGVTLTIEPGVEMKFTTGAKLIIKGTLKAIGTEDDPISFTSNGTTPVRGIWEGIEFKS